LELEGLDFRKVFKKEAKIEMIENLRGALGLHREGRFKESGTY
jgi:hypothetical protein